MQAAERRKQELEAQSAALEERRKRVAERKAAAALARKEAAEKKLKSLAPGLSADGGMLKPVVASSATDDVGGVGGLESGSQTETGNKDDKVPNPKNFSYLEFEPGLPPLNPWDTPETLTDDLKALAAVMGADSGAVAVSDGASNLRSRSPSPTKTAPMGFHVPGVLPPPISRPQIPPSPAYQRSVTEFGAPIPTTSSAASLPYAPSSSLPASSIDYVSSRLSNLPMPSNNLNTGNSNKPVGYPGGIGAVPTTTISQPTSSSTPVVPTTYAPMTPIVNSPNVYPTQTLPPKPPKHFMRYPPGSPAPYSSAAQWSASSSQAPHPQEQQQQQQRQHSNPRIPPGNQGNAMPGPSSAAPMSGEDEAVRELMNMGFSRQQAVNALEKKGYNLESALNMLLDGS